MAVRTAAAIAHPNIAFIKYWGNKDDLLRLPLNGSILMNLGTLHTRTIVSFRDELRCDTLKINRKEISGEALIRVRNFLQIIRSMSTENCFASVESINNFPIGAGIASSAAAFAALALAGSTAS
jgi:diphosphomevalonate decarboxylase